MILSNENYISTQQTQRIAEEIEPTNAPYSPLPTNKQSKINPSRLSDLNNSMKKLASFRESYSAARMISNYSSNRNIPVDAAYDDITRIEDKAIQKKHDELTIDVEQFTPLKSIPKKLRKTNSTSKSFKALSKLSNRIKKSAIYNSSRGTKKTEYFLSDSIKNYIPLYQRNAKSKQQSPVFFADSQTSRGSGIFHSARLASFTQRLKASEESNIRLSKERRMLFGSFFDQKKISNLNSKRCIKKSPKNTPSESSISKLGMLKSPTPSSKKCKYIKFRNFINEFKLSRTPGTVHHKLTPKGSPQNLHYSGDDIGTLKQIKEELANVISYS